MLMESLALCMIVKNEKENLPRCLASTQPYVDEIVVVDTGSEDGTPEIAAQYDAVVHYFQWSNDFAAARNYALSCVSSKWILVLDADEELTVLSEAFKEKLTNSQTIAYSLIRIEADAPAEMSPLHTLRLFKNLPELRFEGRFHEQLTYEQQALPSSLVQPLQELQILHYGTTVAELPYENLQRNIPILEQARREEGLSLMLLYCLAGMYADTQQLEKAQECYSEAFERLLPNVLEGIRPYDFSFVPSLMAALATQSLKQQDYETVRFLCQRGLEWCPSFPPLNYLAGVLLRALGFPIGAIAYFERCLQLGQTRAYYTGEPFDLKYTTLYPACDLGDVYFKLGQLSDAIAAYELALSFDETCAIAQQNLARIRASIAST